MSNKIKEVTSYYRAAVAAHVNKKIEFKDGNFYYFTFEELINGKIDKSIFEGLVKSDKETKERENINVIIAAKTIKTNFDSGEKVSSNFEDLTGIYYIPAILRKDGELSYDEGKFPWIPREFLQPMVEAKLSLGHYRDYDKYMSESIGRIHKIRGWKDYIAFAKDIYENITKGKFENSIVLETKLDKNIYILKDDTVNAIQSILRLYDSLISKYEESKLYEKFINLKYEETMPLIPNEISQMNKHCGQMGGEHELSTSQRECINHFSNMSEGEILAVNGPPGTGKTTLLQSIVANLYVEKALKKEKAPLIVAASTNNQAVTNIIESFGKIKILGYDNLEEHWINGVNSFAVYFPSQGSEAEKKAKREGYQYTSQWGGDFIAEVESKENIEQSTKKLVENCNKFFNANLSNVVQCRKKIHEVLCGIDTIRKSLLDLFNKFEAFETNGKTIDKYFKDLSDEGESLEKKITLSNSRLESWRKHYKNMSFLYKLLKFLKSYKRKIAVKNRLFLNSDEVFLNEYMSLDDIEEKYSFIIKEVRDKLQEVNNILKKIQPVKAKYDEALKRLNELNIDLFSNIKEEEIPRNLKEMNELIDKTLRYIQFWLAVHYYESRWAEGEDALEVKEKTRTVKSDLEKRYSRLSMLTPCYVMTFYQLPKNFSSYTNGKQIPMYNFIDLLIVDEAGQVSPEIAACSFSLAKKAVVVGDIYQIEPVWSVSNFLDISIAKEKGVIEREEEFERFSKLGLNVSDSSVMRAASKSCRYIKFKEKGLFLSEHRRCYNEIISYCNDLVYKELEPKRGKALEDKDYKLKAIPQMGYKLVESEVSSRKGSSRYNKKEAFEIAKWIDNNFEMIKQAYHPKEDTKNLIGVITPFKLQAICIEQEIKKQVSNNIRKDISVGTVHTFQGAERRIIIMSPVYGSTEGCRFIDAKESLLNVAVSRAKDSFLVFGNIDNFKNDPKTPSGCLKKYIKNNKI